jgi:hypothetical protein
MLRIVQALAHKIFSLVSFRIKKTTAGIAIAVMVACGAALAPDADAAYIGTDFFEIKPGMKIVQMLIQKVDLGKFETITDEEFAKLANTERGEGGFGSSGE